MVEEAKVGIDEFKDSMLALLKRLDRREEAEISSEEKSRGKPLSYRVNIISAMGQVGFEVAKLLADSKDPAIDSYVQEINLCHRVLQRGNRTAIPEWEGLEWFDKTELGEAILKNIGNREKIRRTPYEKLAELRCLSDYREGPNSDITIVCSRYGFNRIMGARFPRRNAVVLYSPDGSESAQDVDLSKISDMSLRIRADLMSSFLDIDDKKIRQRIEQVLDTNKGIEEIVRQAKEKGIAENRIYNLRENFLGLAEFGAFLNAIRYQGLVIDVANPVDIGTSVLCSAWGLENARRALGFCDNDRTRMETRLMEDIEQRNPNYKITGVAIPVLGPHNEFLTPVLLETKFYGFNEATGERIDGASFFDLGGTEEMWEQALQYVAELPHRQFKEMGTTAHETAPGIVNVIKSIIESNRGEIVRVSAPIKMNGSYLWTGQPAKIIVSDAYPVKDLNEYDLRDGEKSRLEKGLSIDAFIQEQLEAKGLMPKGMVREMPLDLEVTPERPARIKRGVPVQEAEPKETIDSLLERQYSMAVAGFNEEGVVGQKRTKIYNPSSWMWVSGTFGNKSAEVFSCDFEKAKIGGIFGFVVYTQQKHPEKFLAVRYYRHSSNEIATVYQTNDENYAQRYKEKFEIKLQVQI